MCSVISLYMQCNPDIFQCRISPTGLWARNNIHPYNAFILSFISIKNKVKAVVTASTRVIIQRVDEQVLHIAVGSVM
jgi:hypothetical protein